MISKQNRGDQIISFAVMIQSLLSVLQLVMIGYYHMDSEASTFYRVIFTAIPMIVAMVITMYRKPVRFVIGIVIVVVMMLLTMVVFPENTPFVMSQGFRFLLPIVVPSFLCLTVVKDYKIVERTLYIISWFTLVLVFLYFYGVFSGVVNIGSYNMAFSYACVLPFVAFYSHRHYYDKIVCFVLFVVVLAIGARGPALCMASYVILDLFQYKSRWRFFVLVFVVLFFMSLPSLYNWFEAIGFHSRTLDLFLSGDITHDSGRSDIRVFFINRLKERPVLGLGLFGDRLLKDVPYCHNLILEIILDFGLLVGGFLVILGVIKLFVLYFKSDSNNRNSIIRYFCALVLPFMTSSSYLINSNFAIFIGLCYLFNKEERKNTNVKIS